MHPISLDLARPLGRTRALRAGLAVTAALTGCAYLADAAAAQQGTSCRGSATRYEAPA